MKINNLIILVFLLLQTAFCLNAQWSIKHIDNSINLNIIKFKNDTLGLSMGINSILKSEDTGETWNSVYFEPQINIEDFQFLSDDIVYAVGWYHSKGVEKFTESKLIKSTDNGDTWETVKSFDDKQLFSLWFLNNDTGMLAGYDGIYRTVDSGINWDTVWSITDFGYEFGDLKQIYFPTDEIGYGIGYGCCLKNTDKSTGNFLLKTTDSGLNWDTIISLDDYLVSLYFKDQDTGFIGTQTGKTLKTSDGGYTWTETNVVNGQEVYSFHFISDMIAYAAGAHYSVLDEKEPLRFFISKTIDGGNNWVTYDTIGIPINSIFFINDTTGFVSGLFGLIMKSNGVINVLPDDYPWYLVGVPYINESDYSNSLIEVYPNPTNRVFNILNYSDEKIERIEIINIQGQVKQVLYNISNPIDVNMLKNGIYFIIVYHKSGILGRSKFVVKK